MRMSLGEESIKEDRESREEDREEEREEERVCSREERVLYKVWKVDESYGKG